MAILDMEPREVVALVRLITLADTQGAMTTNEDDELTLFETLPEVKSLAEKINALGEDEAVKAYMAEHYPAGEDEG
jgi:hypothetical protein